MRWVYCKQLNKHARPAEQGYVDAQGLLASWYECDLGVATASRAAAQW